jgi:predicted PurR-regulated permease PerM
VRQCGQNRGIVEQDLDLSEIAEPSAPVARERGIPFNTYTPQWTTYYRRVVIILLIIAGIGALYTLTPVMQTLMMTGLLCFLFYLPSHLLATRTSLNFSCSVMIVYAVLVLVLVLVSIALLPSIVNVIQSIGRAASQLVNRIVDTVTATTAETSTIVVPALNLRIDAWPIIAPVQAALSGETAQAVAGTPALDLGAIVGTLTSITGSLIGSIASIVTTGVLGILLSFLILLDMPRYQAGLSRSIAPIYRREAYLLLGHVNNAWIGFFRGQLVIVVIIGIVTWLQLALIGVGNAIGIAVVVALISLIPTIGGIIALFPMFLVPLISGSSVPMFADMSNLTLALLVTAIYLVWSQVVWTYVAPKILGNAVAIPLPVIIIGISVGLAVGGILGAFLIVPILGTLRIIFSYIVKKLNGKDPFPGEDAPEIEDLAAL